MNLSLFSFDDQRKLNLLLKLDFLKDTTIILSFINCSILLFLHHCFVRWIGKLTFWTESAAQGSARVLAWHAQVLSSSPYAIKRSLNFSKERSLWASLWPEHAISWAHWKPRHLCKSFAADHLHRHFFLSVWHWRLAAAHQNLTRYNLTYRKPTSMRINIFPNEYRIWTLS